MHRLCVYLSQVALAQHTAVSMAKAADWAEGFISEGTLFLETELGRY